MSEWTWELAQPSDAEAFSKWSAENPQIDKKDLEAGMGKNNPTVLVFKVSKNGVVISFAPVYCQFALAHLGFNPEAEGKDRLQSLQVMIDGVMALAVQYGIREIVTLSKEEYGIAKWAVKHGFDREERQLFKIDINKTLALATSGADSAIQEATTICAPAVEK